MDFSVAWLEMELFYVVEEGVVLGGVGRARLIKGMRRTKYDIAADETKPSTGRCQRLHWQ